MVWDELARDAEDENKRDRDKWIGVWIGILAVILALCSMGGGNAAKEATLKNIEASNLWAFFQAKNMRRNMVRLQTDELEIMLAANPGMPDAAKAAIQKKVEDYRALDKRLTSEPETSEGTTELMKRAKAAEGERDVAMAKDPYFDYGEALLQIAIVLASVAIISGGGWLLIGSLVVGGLGCLLTFNGFFLAFSIPGLG